MPNGVIRKQASDWWELVAFGGFEEAPHFIAGRTGRDHIRGEAALTFNACLCKHPVQLFA